MKIRFITTSQVFVWVDESHGSTVVIKCQNVAVELWLDEYNQHCDWVVKEQWSSHFNHSSSLTLFSKANLLICPIKVLTKIYNSTLHKH